MTTVAPLVSVLVTVFNKRPYLAGSLGSIDAQTYPNLEVLIADDGSSDGSVDEMRHLVTTSERLGDAIVIADGSNTGAPTRLNQLVAAASGEWLIRLDADDAFVPQGIERLVQHAAHVPAADVVWGDLEVIDEAGRPKGYSRPRDTWQGPTARRYVAGGHPFDDILRVNSFINGPMTLMRTSAVRGVGAFDPEARIFEDMDLWLRMADRHVFTYCAETVGRYRVVPGSKSRRERVAVLDEARLLGKHVGQSHRRDRGLAVQASMRWALAVARTYGRPGVSLREISNESGIRVSDLLLQLPESLAHPIGGSVAALLRQRVRR